MITYSLQWNTSNGVNGMISFIIKPKTIGIHSAITNTFDISNTCIVRRWHAHDVFSVLF